MPAGEQRLVARAEPAVVVGSPLMATDMLPSMGQDTRLGTDTTLCADVHGGQQAGSLYGALCEGGSEGSPMADMPWGLGGDPRSVRVRLMVDPHPGFLGAASTEAPGPGIATRR